MSTAAEILPPAAPHRTRPEIAIPIWPAAIVIFATILPGEVRFEIGSLQFYAGRIALMLVFPWVVLKTFQGAIKLVFPDLLVILAGFWMYLAMSVNYGMDRGLESGGGQAFDMIASYFLARISLRSATAAKQLLTAAAPIFLAIGLSLVVESLSNRLLVRPFFVSVFGALPTFEGSAGTDLRTDTRLGLLRAYGPFPHPILGGLFMSSLIALYALSKVTNKVRAVGIIAGLSALFTISSAAYAGILLHLALVAYEFLQRFVRQITWRTLVIAIIILMALIQLFTNGGVLNVIIRFTAFDQFTAYYRVLIWQFGGATALANPWFGIGFAGYDRPVWMYSQSVDAHWLLLALRFGLFVPISIGLAVVLTLFALGQSGQRAEKTEGFFYRGLAISLAVFTLQMFTVALWGSPLIWFYILMGFAVSTAQRQLLRYKVKVRW